MSSFAEYQLTSLLVNGQHSSEWRCLSQDATAEPEAAIVQSVVEVVPDVVAGRSAEVPRSPAAVPQSREQIAQQEQLQLGLAAPVSRKNFRGGKFKFLVGAIPEEEVVLFGIGGAAAAAPAATQSASKGRSGPAMMKRANRAEKG